MEVAWTAIALLAATLFGTLFYLGNKIDALGVDVASVAMTVGASGAASVNTVVLLTPEEVDDATQKTVEYRAPGA